MKKKIENNDIFLYGFLKYRVHLFNFALSSFISKYPLYITVSDYIPLLMGIALYTDMLPIFTSQ